MHIAKRGVAVTVPAQGAEGSVGRGGVFPYEQSIPSA
jgi:hypothetical protein